MRKAYQTNGIINMKEKKYDIKARESILEEKEKLYNKLRKHLDELVKFNRKLKEIDKALSSMTDYYSNEWLEDYANFKSDKHFDILSQDLIYNTLQDIHIQKIKILKTIANKLE